MSSDISPLTEQSGRTTFPELDTIDFSNSIVLKLIPNGQFTEEQVEKMTNISQKVLSGYILKHIVFTFEEDEDSELFLCLANGKEWYHNNIWWRLRNEFGQNLILRDAGTYYITDDKQHHFIKSYVSKSLSKERQEITPEECFACREEILNMDIGIELKE